MRTKRRYRRPDLLTVLLVILAVVLAVAFLNHDAGVSLGIPNNDFVRLGALIALLIFVGVGVLGRPLGVGDIVRSLAAWAVVILIVAGLYASRDHLASFAGRTLGALVPGLPVTGQLAGVGDTGSVVITRVRNGHFGVRATVNDIPMQFLVDTGASIVTLTYGDAIRAGIEEDSLDYAVPVRTANGVLTAAPIVIDRIAIGPIERHRMRALVAPPRSLGESLLGLNFLDTLASYTVAGDRMILTP